MTSYSNGHAVYDNETDKTHSQQGGNMKTYDNLLNSKYGRNIMVPASCGDRKTETELQLAPSNLILGASQDLRCTTRTEGISVPICTKPQRRLVDILDRFGDRTSCIGPGYIRSSRTWRGRIFWSCLFLASLVLTVYMTYTNFSDYMDRGTRTSIDIGYAALPFPMVTICNTNPIRRSQINSATSQDFHDFLSELDIPDKGRNDYGWSDLYWNESRDITDPFDSFEREYGAKKDPRFGVQQDFKYYYGQEDSSVKVQMGHQISDMLISCSFSGRQCDDQNFTLTPSNEYGNCYSFNINTSRNLISRRSGNMYGLQLMMYMENHEYIAGLTSGHGARVAITPSGTMPLPELNGIFVSTGAETDVGLKLVNITRLGKPYGVCVQDSFKVTGGFQLEYRYTRQACQETCVHRKILSQCKCFLSSQIHLYPTAAINNSVPCSSQTELNCADSLISSNTYHGNLTCSCPNSCQESTYDTEIANRDWPTNSYVNSLEKMVCDDPTLSDGCHKLRRDEMSDKRRNFLKLNIFYRDLNYEVIAQQPDYPDAQFLSDLGGSIGLFLGLSILSLFEIFELVAEIFEWSLEKCFGGPAPPNQSQYADSGEERHAPDTTVRRHLQEVHIYDPNKTSVSIAPIRYI